MKIAMLGGTFDPIHYGHIMLGERFAGELGLDKVLIIPTKTPPHKTASATPAQHRLAMCRIAARCAGAPFEASDIELRREGLSYSFYTIHALLEEYPGCELYMLIGADMLMSLDTWYRYEEFKHLVTFCAVPREEVTADMLRQKAESLSGCRIIISERPLLQVSSTEIRGALAAGEDTGAYLPPEIAEYIRQNSLYI